MQPSEFANLDICSQIRRSSIESRTDSQYFEEDIGPINKREGHSKEKWC